MTDKITEQKIKTAILRGEEILAENGLDSWRIKVNHKRSCLAETWHEEKTISFSKYFIIVSDKEQFDGIALHEVAHALLGRGKGHGKEFVEMCKKISPTALYARHDADVPIRKYLLKCPRCGQRGSMSTDEARYCGVCIKDKERVKLDSEENKLEVIVW